MSALGCYGMTAITALTAQNTMGVQAIHAPPADFLARQLQSVFEDIGVDAVKIGMLHSPDIVAVVTAALKRYQPNFIVLDPVMVATSGDALITPETQRAIVEALFPLATVVTPNLDELSLLVGRAITHPSQFPDAAREMSGLGAQAVLIKGGHLDQPNLIDQLYEFSGHGADQAPVVTEISNPRINTRNLHGTGCTLSSAVACFLAQGYPLKAAVRGGQDYVYQAIAAGAMLDIGHGHGPVNHGFAPQAMHLDPTIS